jgi:hypothetical protein
MVFFYLLLGIRYLMPLGFLVSTRFARLRRTLAIATIWSPLVRPQSYFE